MSESAPRLRCSTTCPFCGGALWWYHLLFGSLGSLTVALTCPACRAKLRLSLAASLLMVLLYIAGLLVGILFALIEQLGFVTLLIRFALCLSVAGLLAGLVRMVYVLRGKVLIITTAGQLPPKSVRLLSFLRSRLTTLAIYSALLSALLLFFGRARLDQPALPSGPNPPVLGQADASWKLETLDGQEVSFGNFAGRAVFLNIWATWCPPCVAEVPSIQDLHDALKDEDVAVVLVTQERPETVRPFVEKKGWHVPVYIARGGAPAVFKTDAIPATFLINRRGEVVFHHTGRADWNTEDCRGFLRRLQRE